MERDDDDGAEKQQQKQQQLEEEEEDGGVPDFARFLEEEGRAAESELREEEKERLQQREMASAVLEMMDLENKNLALPENPDRQLRFQGGFLRGAVVRKGSLQRHADSAGTDASAGTAKSSSHAHPVGSSANRRKSFLSSTRDYIKRKGATVGKALGASGDSGVATDDMLVHARSVRDFVNMVTAGKIKDEADHMLQAFIFDDYLVLARMRNTTGRLAAIASFELLDVSVRDMASSHFVYEDDVLGEDSDADEDEDASDDQGDDSNLSDTYRNSETADSSSRGGRRDDDGSASVGRHSLRSYGSGVERASSRGGLASGENAMPSSTSTRQPMLEILCGSSGTRLVLDAGGEPHKHMWIEQVVAAVKDAVRRERPVRASSRGWEHGIRRGTIWSAAHEGLSHEVGRILSKHPEQVSMSDDNGVSPLHMACIGGRTLTAAQLLRAGASASDVDNDLMTPLHYAALKHQANIVPMILSDDWENGADVDAQDLQSRTPLIVACRESAEDPSQAAAFVESIGGFGPETEIADVNGDTALLVAVRRGQGGLVASLLKIGAKTETTSVHTGLTPLLVVCKSPRPMMGILNKLLLGGANPNAHCTDADGSSQSGLRLLVESLESAHAEEHVKDAEEGTKVAMGDNDNCVATEDCLDCIQLLVSFGARVDMDDIGQALERVGADVSDAVQHWSSRTEPADIGMVAARQTYRIPFAIKSSDFVDSASCTSCSVNFKMLDKRQHCRKCAQTFCAKCTTKSVSMRSLDDQSISQTRVCNACFNMLCKTYTMLVHDARALAKESAASASGQQNDQQKPQPQPLSAGAQPMSEQKPMAQRRAPGASAKTNAVQETLGQTRDALIERGERLGRLGEASAALSNNAGDFSSMARKLREREEKNAGWFGGLF